jgi:Arc/MetJ family transcription regulator
MATNLAIDDELLEEALRIGGHKTKKAAIVALFGKVDIDPDYDYKQRRQRR